ncbi:30S ribosomal protein S4 [Candidatus Gracilibacteria bacterium]|nr:30S ribosomal protein S4 [Candidatus Gracilibacteria bacterium]
MGRYLGPICRLCRREGMKLCDKHKCASVRRPYPPGMHGQARKGKQSDYSKQLREKQKARRIFGISEKQMVRYYKVATHSAEQSGLKLIEQMERRLDNAVFRSGLAQTRRQARQMVAHGTFTLNGHRVTIPSIQVKDGDTFTVREKNKGMPVFQNLDKRKPSVPKWLSTDTNALTGKVVGKPEKEDLEQAIQSSFIIEFYSR